MNRQTSFSRLFVLGHSHCGSTLLGRILDMHQDVLCPGEFLWLDDALRKQLPCSCGQRMEDCSFWSHHLPNLPPCIREDYTTTGKNVFDALAAREGKSVMVDLSKSRVYRHRASWDWDGNGFIFVVRDPRALLAARLREGGELEHELRRHRKWQRRFERLTRRMGKRAMTMYYEDFVGRPADGVRAICSFVGIDFDEGMLRPTAKEHHFLHSSVSPYLKGSDQIVLDDRWRSELSSEQVARINR
jgi:hypothetical protein